MFVPLFIASDHFCHKIFLSLILKAHINRNFVFINSLNSLELKYSAIYFQFLEQFTFNFAKHSLIPVLINSTVALQLSGMWFMWSEPSAEITFVLWLSILSYLSWLHAQRENFCCHAMFFFTFIGPLTSPVWKLSVGGEILRENWG